MKIDVIDMKRDRIGEIELSDELFSLAPRLDILSRVVRWQLAKRHAGTHCAKTISDVSGTGKKSVRQKGSGGARHGSRRGTQFRGGGIVFGPTPRSYDYSLPKKIRKLGLRMAIADKIQSGELVILNEFVVDVPKTKFITDSFSWLESKSGLFVDDCVCESLIKSFKNCACYDIIPQIGLNVYDIMRKDFLVLTRSSVESLEARLHG
ncbi:MAG: 50S ribosomal protein L4 [Holosporales bacterium]|jgi:large subunit ribosomal protein L4|nr:50S ribosomal protein L4 [Holosporales bacterium]